MRTEYFVMTRGRAATKEADAGLRADMEADAAWRAAFLADVGKAPPRTIKNAVNYPIQ